MNCKETQQAVLQYIKEEMDSKTEKNFLKHIEECEACREELTIQYLVEKGLEYLEDGKTFDLQKELKNKTQASKRRIRRQEMVAHVIFYFIALIGTCSLIVFLVGVLIK